MGSLFVVGTPIGNLEDVTYRAVRVLGQVTLIAAEDTRTTRKLLAHYGLKTPVTSYNEHNRRKKTPYLLARLEEGDVALVSEAGTPGISDPGQELIARCIESGITVVTVPGPSAIVSALAVSGMATKEFLFVGFLPRTSPQRRRFLKAVARVPWSLVLFESPHRLLGALEDMNDVLGDRRAVVCREMTKLYEEVFRGTLSEIRDHFVEPRGEFTLILQRYEGPAEETDEKSEDLRKLAETLSKQGLSTRDAVSRLTRLTVATRRQAYRALLQSKDG